MTMKQIEARQSQENRKYELAKQIRKLLDDYLAGVGKDERDEAETEIIDLVTGDAE